MPQNEDILLSSISSQCNTIRNSLNEYCLDNNGIAVVAENVNEQTMAGYKNVLGPRILVVFLAEDIMGDDSVAECVGRVRRHFDILVSRGKLYGEPRDSVLSNDKGPVQKFYQQVEDIRDILRVIEFPTPLIQAPVEYHGIRPGNQDDWMLDSYIISISTIVDIGKVGSQPPELVGNNNPNFNWSQGIQTSPIPNTGP